MAPERARRNDAVDLLRSASVVSIIILHVTLANASRLSRGPDNLDWTLAAVLGSIFTNETLVFISLRLALAKLNIDDYRGLLVSRLARIGIPFVGFTILYVLLDAAGPRQGVIFKFPPLQAVALLLIAGLGEYHLHFLPALLLLVLILPVFAAGLSLRMILIAILAGSCARFLIECAVIENASGNALTAGQLLLLHAGKIAAYFPFGFLAQWFLCRDSSAHPRDDGGPRTRYVLLLVLLGTAAVDLTIMTLPTGGQDGRLGFAVLVEEILGSLLIVLGIFVAAAWSSDWKAGGLAEAVYRSFYSRAFLILMIHPALLKTFQWMTADRRPSSTILCVIFVLSASWALAGGLDWVAGRMRRAWRSPQPGSVGGTH